MLAYVVTFAATVAVGVKAVPSSERSIWNPPSVVALSVHVRLIWLLEMATAAKFVGAAGGADAGTPMRIIFAMDGTPVPFSTNNM